MQSGLSEAGGITAQNSATEIGTAMVTVTIGITVGLFISQALVETGLAEEEENRESLVRALKWLDVCQIKDHPRHFELSYRHPTRGAWPFSTRTQGYTVSDCTGEGLKAVLYIQNHVP